MEMLRGPVELVMAWIGTEKHPEIENSLNA